MGSFIYCKNQGSLELIREEILNKKKRHPELIFNIITSGSDCKDLLKFIEENKEFDNCIKNICIFCWELEKYQKYKNECKKIFDVYKKTSNVIDFFLIKTQTKNHYFKTKLITEEYYTKIYNSRHFEIA